MQQTYFDQQKYTFIKVFSSSNILEREFCGLKTFSKFCQTPSALRLDSKVAKISKINGYLGYQIKDQELNSLIAILLKSVPQTKIVSKFTIYSEINKLKKHFKYNKNLLKALNSIEKSIRHQKLVPVHGDLQKLNIVISFNKLNIIDFEHFIFAPKELELVNSLFFDDSNCLDIQSITKLLPQNFLNKKILKKMLEFYTIKQISLGMDEKLAFKKLNQATLKINPRKTKINLKITLTDTTSSYCFA